MGERLTEADFARSCAYLASTCAQWAGGALVLPEYYRDAGAQLRASTSPIHEAGGGCRDEKESMMTPLAERVLRRSLGDMTDEHTRFWRLNSATTIDALRDAHFFEFTEAIPMLVEVSAMLKSSGVEKGDEIIDGLSFLPAPKTWLEWKHPFGMRLGLLLCQDPACEFASVELFFDEACSYLGTVSLLGNEYQATDRLIACPKALGEHYGSAIQPGLLALCHTVLVLINSPRLIGRRQRMPTGRIERLLLKQAGKIAKPFPVGAWTEIKLEITPPREAGDDEHEAHLTGKRALHFCRSHLRIRCGQFELVKAHWRGDAALGIKQSRYKLAHRNRTVSAAAKEG